LSEKEEICYPSKYVYFVMLLSIIGGIFVGMSIIQPQLNECQGNNDDCYSLGNEDFVLANSSGCELDPFYYGVGCPSSELEKPVVECEDTWWARDDNTLCWDLCEEWGEPELSDYNLIFGYDFNEETVNYTIGLIINFDKINFEEFDDFQIVNPKRDCELVNETVSCPMQFVFDGNRTKLKFEISPLGMTMQSNVFRDMRCLRWGENRFEKQTIIYIE